VELKPFNYDEFFLFSDNIFATKDTIENPQHVIQDNSKADGMYGKRIRLELN